MALDRKRLDRLKARLGAISPKQAKALPLPVLKILAETAMLIEIIEALYREHPKTIEFAWPKGPAQELLQTYLEGEAAPWN